MLTRAARRHARQQLSRHLKAATFEQLSLPWLSPTSHNVLDFRRQSSSLPLPNPPHRHRNQSPDRQLSALSSKRYLATEALLVGSDQYIPESYGADSYIPFEGVPGYSKEAIKIPQDRSFGRPTPNGMNRDDSGLVILSHDGSRSSRNRPRTVTVSGLDGDPNVLYESLYALVRVGRFAQAERVVRRLVNMYPPNTPELLDAHHRYLTGRLASLYEAPAVEVFAKMQRWFELDIRAQASIPTSGILAVMIKAAFLVLTDSRLDRTVRRYLSLAKEIGNDVRDEVSAAGIFTSSEWLAIVRLQPQDYVNPDQIMAEEDIPDQISAIATAVKVPSVLPTSTETAPELKGADLKGLGLKALKQTLVSFEEADPNASDAGSIKRQRRLESDVITSALARWREEAETNQAMRQKEQPFNARIGSYVFEWIQDMKAMIKDDVKRGELIEEKPDMLEDEVDLSLLSPFLKLADAEKLCATTVMEYVHYIGYEPHQANSVRSLTNTVSRIGTAIRTEITNSSKQTSMIERIHSLPSTTRHKKVMKLLKRQNSGTAPPVRYLEEEVAEPTKQFSGDRSEGVMKMKLGAYFLSIFMKVAKLPVTRTDPNTGKKVTRRQPISLQSYRWFNGKKVGVIVTHPELLDRLKREPNEVFLAKHLPMIVKPRPWKDLSDGAYLSTKLSAVRFRDTSLAQQKYLRLASKRGDMKQTYAGLDVVGKVAWRINRPVFNVIAEAWNTGQPIGGLAPSDPPNDFPEKPTDGDPAAFMRWKSIMTTMRNQQTGHHSQRCYQNFQFEVARAYLNDTFYCPHSADFRGRAYPIPPYFNHMGADYVRGLFLFANGRKLGDVGLKWLKIHLANVYGYDKASLSDREKFTMDHIAEVYDSALNPLNGKRWWLTAGDPWQCLAACMEMKNALDMPNPSEYVSHLPVHQDGTCNGLQHYAALGGDMIGARQVNLVPGDRPADIYSAVADMVAEDVAKAAAEGNIQAQALDGKISRRVVKQPVMTNVYGVTYHGARAQVLKQLNDILPKTSLHASVNNMSLAAYVATLIFKSLARMFVGASAIQRWLGDCGALISTCITPEQMERIKSARSPQPVPPPKRKFERLPQVPAPNPQRMLKEDFQFKSTIVWTTPLGMPVVQPYRKPRKKVITTTLQKVVIHDTSFSDPVSKRKQLQGFPPNFIHSLDATHMMLSALKCDEIGLQFSSVHDSFWTHAADIPIMNRILRDAFVRMHSEDIVGRLREEFGIRYKGCMSFVPVQQGSPLALKIIALRRSRGVVNSHFKQPRLTDGPQVDELIEEYERQRLLKSDNPMEQVRGKEMITPASLFEAEPHASTFVDRVDGNEIATLRSGMSENLGDIFAPNRHSEKEVNVFDEVDGEHGEEIPTEDVSLSSAQEGLLDENGETVDPDLIHSGDDPGLDVADDVKASTESARKKKDKKRSSGYERTWLWMPTQFPEAPARGDFDVASLKDSKYFFS